MKPLSAQYLRRHHVGFIIPPSRPTSRKEEPRDSRGKPGLVVELESKVRKVSRVYNTAKSTLR